MNDLILKINRKDIRSGVTWCNTNDVDIYKDRTGKYVLESEFNLAYDLPIIKRYREKYGDNWEEMFELAKSDTLYKSISNISTISNKRYKPKGSGSVDFLKKYNK
jgi:hypothetical protein